MARFLPFALPKYLVRRAPELLVILVAILTRFWRLDYHSFWFDEAVSLSWAAADIDYTWRVTFQLVEEKHPPVYYISLHLWQQGLGLVGLGYHDAALRAWGAILGVLTVWGILRLGTGISGRTVGLLAGLLTALSPLLVWYSQELRMFQPATTGIVWFSVALWQAWHTDKIGRRIAWWLLTIVSMTAALYSYLFSAFMLPVGGLVLLTLFLTTRKARRFMEGSAALLVIATLFLPLARNAWSVNAAESTPGQPFANFLPNLARLLRTDTIWRVDWPDAWITLTLSFFAALVLAGLSLRANAADQNPPRHVPVERLWLWLWLGVPLLIANVLLARSRSIFSEDRYLLFLAPFVLWAVARGVVALGRFHRTFTLEAATLAVLALALALPPLWSPAHQREEWRAASHYILDYQAASPSLPAAVVAHVDYTHQPLFWYILRQAGREDLPIFFPFGGVLTPDDADTIVAPPLMGLVDFGAATLWLTQSHLDGVDDQRVVEGWLTARFPMVTEQYPPGVKLTGYMLQDRFATLPPLSSSAVMPHAELAPGITLIACEITTPSVAARDEIMHPPSGWVHVRAWWRLDAPVTENYVATAQVIGPEGVWGDRLHRPTEALRLHPTSTWAAGEIRRDELDINLNPLTPAGDYSVMIGIAVLDGDPLPATTPCGQVTIR